MCQTDWKLGTIIATELVNFVSVDRGFSKLKIVNTLLVVCNQLQVFHSFIVDKVTESNPNTIMIVILVCAAMIVLLLALTVVFLVRKRRNANPTTSLDVIPMQYPADKMMAFENGQLTKD